MNTTTKTEAQTRREALYARILSRPAPRSLTEVERAERDADREEYAGITRDEAREEMRRW